MPLSDAAIRQAKPGTRAIKMFDGRGLGHEADDDGDQDADDPGPEGAVEVLGHGPGVGAHGDVLEGAGVGLDPDEHGDGGDGVEGKVCMS